MHPCQMVPCFKFYDLVSPNENLLFSSIISAYILQMREYKAAIISRSQESLIDIERPAGKVFVCVTPTFCSI